VATLVDWQEAQSKRRCFLILFELLEKLGQVEEAETILSIY